MLYSGETEWTRAVHINPVASIEGKKQDTEYIILQSINIKFLKDKNKEHIVKRYIYKNWNDEVKQVYDGSKFGRTVTSWAEGQECA